MKKDFNRDSHPERQEDEVFIGNFFKEPEDSLHLIGRRRSGFNSVGWKTKRKGNKGYDRNGNYLPGSYPVFVKQSEIEEADPKILKQLLPRK